MGERCLFCKKKVGLMIFKCHCCENVYCVNHRLPEDHECSSDFKGIAHDKHVKKIEKDIVITPKHNKI